MNYQRAQIFWSSVVAITVTLLALYNAFSGKPEARGLLERSPSSTADHLFKDSPDIR